MKTVHIIGVPLDLGAGRRGVDMGPSAVRIAGLGDRLASMGCRVVDKGNIAVPIRETRIPRPMRPARRYWPNGRLRRRGRASRQRDN